MNKDELGTLDLELETRLGRDAFQLLLRELDNEIRMYCCRMQGFMDKIILKRQHLKEQDSKGVWRLPEYATKITVKEFEEREKKKQQFYEFKAISQDKGKLARRLAFGSAYPRGLENEARKLVISWLETMENNLTRNKKALVGGKSLRESDARIAPLSHGNLNRMITEPEVLEAKQYAHQTHDELVELHTALMIYIDGAAKKLQQLIQRGIIQDRKFSCQKTKAHGEATLTQWAESMAYSWTLLENASNHWCPYGQVLPQFRALRLAKEEEDQRRLEKEAREAEKKIKKKGRKKRNQEVGPVYIEVGMAQKNRQVKFTMSAIKLEKKNSRKKKERALQKEMGENVGNQETVDQRNKGSAKDKHEYRRIDSCNEKDLTVSTPKSKTGHGKGSVTEDLEEVEMGARDQRKKGTSKLKKREKPKDEKQEGHQRDRGENAGSASENKTARGKHKGEKTEKDAVSRQEDEAKHKKKKRVRKGKKNEGADCPAKFGERIEDSEKCQPNREEFNHNEKPEAKRSGPDAPLFGALDTRNGYVPFDFDFVDKMRQQGKWI